MKVGACGRCGKNPAEGSATINGVPYCHGDYDEEPTCYMRSSWGPRTVTIRLDPEDVPGIQRWFKKQKRA